MDLLRTGCGLDERNTVGSFKINKAGMQKLQRDPENQFSGGIQVPLEGSADDAIQSVNDQFKRMGATPNDAAEIALSTSPRP